MAPALGMGLLLGLLWDPGGATRVLHSLHYLHMAVSEPSPGLPQFMSTGYLDGIPFTRCDSEQGQVVPLTQWIKDGADQGYWNREIEICVLNQHVYARGLDTLRTRYNQSGGCQGAEMGICRDYRSRGRRASCYHGVGSA